MYYLHRHLLKPNFTWSTLIQTPFQKEETAAHLHDLKKQPRLDHNDHLILGCIFARNAVHMAQCCYVHYGSETFPQGAFCRVLKCNMIQVKRGE